MGLLSENSLGGQPAGYTWGDSPMPQIPPEVAFQEALKRLAQQSDYASALAAPGANQGQIYAQRAAAPVSNDMDTYTLLNAQRNAHLSGDQTAQTTAKDRIEFEQKQARQKAVDDMLKTAMNGGTNPVAAAPAAVAAPVDPRALGGTAPGVDPSAMPAAAGPAGPAAAKTLPPDPLGFRQLSPQQQMAVLNMEPEKRIEAILKLTSKAVEPVKITTNDGREVTMYKKADGTLVDQDHSGLNLGQGSNPYSQGKLTESEAAAASYADRMARSHVLMNANENGGMSRAVNIGESIPLINSFQPAEAKNFQQARDNFITAMLRRESGAAISSGEYAQAYKTFIPQPGDPEAVLKQKAAARAQIVEGNLRAAGPNYKAPTGWEKPDLQAHASFGRGGSQMGVVNGQHIEFLPDGTARLVGAGGK